MSNPFLKDLLAEDGVTTVTETATSFIDSPGADDAAKVDLGADDIGNMLSGPTVDGTTTADLSEATLDIDDEQALQALAEAMDVVTEGVNIVRLNRQTKLLNLTNRSALVLAKRANDPLFAKYAKFNKVRRDIRDQIVKKYGAKATSYARKVMTSTTPSAGAAAK